MVVIHAREVRALEAAQGEPAARPASGPAESLAQRITRRLKGR